MKHILAYFFTCVCCLSNFAIAKPYYGANFSYVAVSRQPENLHGYQVMLKIEPECLNWHQFDLYFDGGYSRFTIPDTYHYSTLNIYSISPVLRFSLKKYPVFTPYLELSIGLSYMDRTRLEHCNLGMHFAFQDRAGIGFFLGRAEQVSLGFHIIHYSNAHLSSNNSGISIPLLLDVGYRF